MVCISLSSHSLSCIHHSRKSWSLIPSDIFTAFSWTEILSFQRTNDDITAIRVEAEEEQTVIYVCILFFQVLCLSSTYKLYLPTRNILVGPPLLFTSFPTFFSVDRSPDSGSIQCTRFPERLYERKGDQQYTCNPQQHKHNSLSQKWH